MEASVLLLQLRLKLSALLNCPLPFALQLLRGFFALLLLARASALQRSALCCKARARFLGSPSF